MRRSRRRCNGGVRGGGGDDPAKVLLDLALGLAVGGDCLADVGCARRAGRVRAGCSDPTVSRTIDRLADDADRVLARSTPRAAVRAQACGWPGPGPRPRHQCRPATGHRRGRDPGDRPQRETRRSSDLQARVRPSPVVGVPRPRPHGTGEPVAALLRPGNAGSNTAADHLIVIRAAPAPTAVVTGPGADREEDPDQSPTVPAPPTTCSDWLATQPVVVLGRVRPHRAVVDELAALPASTWQPAYNADGRAPAGRLESSRPPA